MSICGCGGGGMGCSIMWQGCATPATWALLVTAPSTNALSRANSADASSPLVAAVCFRCTGRIRDRLPTPMSYSQVVKDEVGVPLKYLITHGVIETPGAIADMYVWSLLGI